MFRPISIFVAVALVACSPPPTAPDSVPPATRATPASGSFASPLFVSFVCRDEGSGCAATHYTVDGSEPGTTSPAFEEAIELVADATVKFFSVDRAGNAEPVQRATYTVRKGGGSSP